MTELLFTGEQLGRLALQFLLAGAGTLSFAILFACPRRTLPYCGLVGAVGWLVYEIAELFGMEAFAASLLAVIPLLTRLTNSLSIPTGVSPPGKLTRHCGSFSMAFCTRSVAHRLIAS